MDCVLHYGSQGSVALNLPDGALLTECAAPRGRPLERPGAAVAQALMDPLGFPSLARATVPGDRVTLAVGHSVPALGEVVRAVLQRLLADRIPPGNVTVLLSAAADAAHRAALENLLAESSFANVTLRRHDSDDRVQLSYLAATPGGRPIYLNRAVCEADVVVPIGCLRGHDSWGYHGIFGGLYPAFSDAATERRYRHPRLAWTDSPLCAKARRESDAVGWLLGSVFVVQLVPGGGDTVLHVLAGDPQAVAQRGEQLWHEAWHFDVPQRADLVVAGLGGNASEQTWDNVARALAAAERCVEADGTIALCTELEAEPGPALKSLSDCDEVRQALRRLDHPRGPDTLAATALVHARQSARLYLLSRLDDATVEDLGMAPVERAEDIARLVRRHKSCIVLSNAQYVQPTAASDARSLL